jgi:hypothetical protein
MDSSRRRLVTRWGHNGIALLSFCLLAISAEAQAADRPISGRSLKVASTATGARFVFISRDPSFLFPPIGSIDDPASGAPGGIVIEIFTQSELQQTISAPAGAGNPGWTAKSGADESYVYRSDGATLRKAVLREDKLIRLQSDDSGLSLSAPLGGVAIRITTGTLRNCAVFDASTVRRDQPGLFLARDASSAGLSDCSDGSLLAPLGLDCDSKGDAPTCGGPCPGGNVCVPGPGDTCTCQQPCGATVPECGGTCAAEEECVGLVGGLGTVHSCVCTPIGVTPCGAAGSTCGEGACGAGLECQSVDPYLEEPYCACIDPTQLCGAGGSYCPPDSECMALPGGQFGCVPTFCSGPYPTCGGTCGGGRNCVPLNVLGSGLCVCAAPENECEGAMCGGFSCPAGEVCTPDVPSAACTCEPL